MHYNIQTFTIIYLAFFCVISTYKCLGQDEEGRYSFDHRFGMGYEMIGDHQAYSMLNFLYRTKGNHKFKVGVGSASDKQIEYRDADFKLRQLRLHNRAISVSYALPIGVRSAFFLEGEFRFNWLRSSPVEQWVDLDPLRYQKKFTLYHDMNRYTTNLSINWMPMISDNFEFILSLYPSWTYIEFPSQRQTDPLYENPVRRRFLSDFESPEKSHFFHMGAKFGLSWYFL